MAARSGLPTALERREILYGDNKRPPDYAALGRDYLEAGRRADALECFEKVTDAEAKTQAIRELKQNAIRDGNWFLLRRVHLSQPLSTDEWREAAQRAKEQGKLRYALRSAREAKDEPLVLELEAALGIERAGELPAAVLEVPTEVSQGAEGSAGEAEGASADDAEGASAGDAEGTSAGDADVDSGA